MRTLIASVLLAALLALPGAAQDEFSYTRFLVPLYSRDIPGAYGSLWQARTWLRYSGIAPAVMIPGPFCFGVMCPLGGVIEPNWPSVPFQTLPGFEENAILVYIENPYAAHVTFESRIRDLSRAAESAGTEVPVIREDDILSAPVYLLNLPVDPRFRHTLRVYALPEVEDPEVEVRYFRQPSDRGPRLDLNITLLRSERVRLRTRRDANPVQLYPSIAEIGNLQSFPELAGETTVWIEVVPVTPGLRIWAFDSVTNNETQQVTLITPSR